MYEINEKGNRDNRKGNGKYNRDNRKMNKFISACIQI